MRRHLARLAALPAHERAVLLRAWGLFFVVELALRARRAHRLARRLERKGKVGSPPPDVPRVSHLVELAARAVPFTTTCLTKSLVLGWTLAWLGMPVRLRVGVARRAGDLHAHAWLESNGEPIASLDAGDGYTPLRAVAR